MKSSKHKVSAAKSPKPVRVAVIGCGYWGPNLIRNFAETPGVELTAICDRNPAALDKLRRRYPSVSGIADYRNVISDPGIDAVAIATAVEAHYPIARAALERGKHVLIEKPLASTVREGEALTKLAHKNGLTLMVDHTFVYKNSVQIIKQHLPELGALRYFDSTRVNLGLFQKDINVIWDLAPHDFSMLLYLLDEDPTEILAVGSAHIDPKIENTGYVIARFRNNLTAHFHFNWLSPVKVRQTLISGSKKMIVYNDLDSVEPVKIYDCGVNLNKVNKEKILIEYRSSDIWSPCVAPQEALKNVTAAFERSIRSGKAPYSDGRFGVRVLRLLEACDRSLRRRSFVKV